MSRISTAIFAALAVGACSSDPPAGDAPPFTELSTATTTEHPVEGAPPGHRVRATRVDDQGRRTIEHFDGTSWATFLDAGEGLIAVNVEGAYRDGQTLLCAQAVGQTEELAGLIVACAVRVDGAPAFAARGTLEGEPNAWLNDVCAGEGGGAFTLLVSSARTPFPDLATLAELEQPPCGALAWTGTAWEAAATTVCACDQLDGKPCDDPCYVGGGVWSGGRCDTGGHAFRCDDGDPSTADYCTGDQADLCMHEVGAELLP